MKKILLSILSVGVFISTYGQTADGGGLGIEVGLRGAAASNWMFNKNVSNAGTQSYAAAFSYNYGLDFAFDINEHIAIEANLLWGNTTQGYSGKFGTNEWIPMYESVYGDSSAKDGETYTSKTVLKTMSIPLLLRFGSGNGAYIEIGPEYQIISSVTYSANYSGQPSYMPSSISAADVSSAFATSNIQGVLGFGDDFQIGSTGLNIITNLRFYYGFTDLKGVDGLGQNMATSINGQSNDALYSGKYGGTSSPYYSGYQATHSAGASFSIGLYYYFGLTKNNGGRHMCKHAPKVRD